jgi:transmembrane sensor
MTVNAPESAAEAARHLQVDWHDRRLEQNLERVHERRAQARQKLWLAGAVTAVAAAAALVLLLGGALRGPVRVSTSPNPAPAPVVESSKTTFADGSVARTAPGAELVVRSATAERVESLLVTGSVDFEITKNPKREFVVVAGAVLVRVVGTRFRVERSGERTRVSVSEGKVEVQEGEERSYLEAGESRFFPSIAPTEAKPEPAAQGPSARARFLELARGGKFQAAYQVMSQSPAAVGSGAEDLMLAADAARLSGHPEQAVGYLRRVSTEHSSDSRAPLAAFTLGRLLLSQLGRPGEAAEAFALARRLRPAGSLSEDALAREAEARARAGSGSRARALASEYLTSYPSGKHHSTMQRLATGQ